VTYEGGGLSRESDFIAKFTTFTRLLGRRVVSREAGGAAQTGKLERSEMSKRRVVAASERLRLRQKEAKRVLLGLS
jgi:hypothetical protein